MIGARAWLAASIVWLGIASSSAVSAHPLDPALLELRELGSSTLDVSWRFPAGTATDVPLRVVLDDCRELFAPVASHSGPRNTLHWRAQCSGELVGRRVAIAGLRERRTDALLRVHLADGRLIETVLRADAPSLVIPARASRLDVARDYLRLGSQHIAGGYDHLLFVLGLALLVHGRRRLLWTITAFTAGHSVTLSLAVLGVVRIPPRPVEVLIALTLVLLAVDLSADAASAPSWMRRWPWAMAFSFGLLHGLGFAGALTEAGLPAHEVPLALAAFNAGIELGQLVCVALVLTVRAGLSTLPLRWPRVLRLVPAYAIGSLAVFWICERVAVLL